METDPMVESIELVRAPGDAGLFVFLRYFCWRSRSGFFSPVLSGRINPLKKHAKSVRVGVLIGVKE
jgi:hypothetical protein